MKAILEYNIDENDDRMAHIRAIKSLDMALAIWEIVYNTKKKILSKVESENLSAYDSVELVYEKIWECLNEHNVVIDELVQ